jgi:hypothetical protein
MTGASADPTKYSCQIAGQECTVSSIDSSINMVYVEVPKYDISNELFGVLQQSSSDTSTQINPYLGSNGFKYSRYSLDKYLSLS